MRTAPADVHFKPPQDTAPADVHFKPPQDGPIQKRPAPAGVHFQPPRKFQLSHFLSLQSGPHVKPRGQYDQKRTSEDGKTNKTDEPSISSGELKDFPAPSVHINERDPVANLIESKLQGIPKSSGESNCIYRVPKSFRKGNKESYYKPWAVPIGPYHLGAGGGLEVMQAFKFNYVKAFLDRYNKMNLDLCVQTVGGIPDVSYADLTLKFFKQLVKIEKFPGHVVCHEVKHFVDFVRHCYYLPSLPLEKEQREDNNNVICECPTVTTLVEAGVKFVTKTCTSSSFLDIQFKDGVLQIPGFAIDDWTTTLFLNLITFEQCHEHPEKYISHYIFLMRCMIRTSKDVDLLVQNKIISSRPGSSRDLLTLLDHIGKDVGLGQTNCYFSLCKNLNAYVTQKNEETRNQCIPLAEEVDNNSQEQLFQNSLKDYVYYCCSILILLTFIYEVYYYMLYS
ncbi:hypothetical protein GBA52_023918 [Prunus armeniaca]|nr:hypothetical protein GBA52_023918 [Prunus armeniaca]